MFLKLLKKWTKFGIFHIFNNFQKILNFYQNSFVGSYFYGKQTKTIKNDLKVFKSCFRWCIISLTSHWDKKWLWFFQLNFCKAFGTKALHLNSCVHEHFKSHFHHIKCCWILYNKPLFFEIFFNFWKNQKNSEKTRVLA